MEFVYLLFIPFIFFLIKMNQCRTSTWSVEKQKHLTTSWGDSFLKAFTNGFIALIVEGIVLAALWVCGFALLKGCELEQTSHKTTTTQTITEDTKTTKQIFAEMQTDLFDMKTGKRILAKDFKDLESGIRDGRYGYGASRELNILDQDGNIFHVDAAHLQAALKQGYRLETPEHAAARSGTNNFL